MALSTVKFNPISLHFPLPTDFYLNNPAARRRRTNSTARFVVLSAHSSAQILKSYANTRYKDTLPHFHADYEDDEDEDEDEGEDEDEDEDEDFYWHSDDESLELDESDTDKKINNLAKGMTRLQGESVELDEFATDRKTNNLAKVVKKRRGKQRKPDKGVLKSLQSEGSLIFNKDCLDVGNKRQIKKSDMGKNSITTDKPKMRAREHMQNKYPRMFEEVEMDAKWIPLLDYLSSFGLKESHFIQICERNVLSLQTNVVSAQERLDYLMSVGVKQRDIRRILLRQPQILAYTVENNLKPHVNFLAELGIPSSRIGQIIANAPSLFSYSVENSLKPTVRYLIEEVGIKENCLGKVVHLSPQILVQQIDISWNTRLLFFSEELGAPRDSIVKMVTKHPQFLHYSIDDGLLPRINFLRSIGMCNSEILKVLTSLTQVLSLSLEDNLKPKYMYLVNDLKNEVQSLTKYPMYLSLSLDQRIRPRHRFLVSLKKAPKGPFPLSSFVPTDESFCQQWAGTSLDKYLEFRQSLLLQKLADKYEKR